MARRGPESVLLEVQAIEQGADAPWKTSVRACTDVNLAIINLDRLRTFVLKHPEVELDIRACKPISLAS